MIRDARFHGRCEAQRLVNPAEVVEREPEAVGGPEVFHFLLKAFVSRVMRRICILIVRFWRSM